MDRNYRFLGLNVRYLSNLRKSCVFLVGVNTFYMLSFKATRRKFRSISQRFLEKRRKIEYFLKIEWHC